ncbi:hypothetical protein SAMN05660916_02250 [Arthrobacter sp. 31Cvi3.1E]|nr:hypothetical protein SAMN05660916_02250 [Arthrobacter sp. 31Cvi3.1E]
MTTPAPLLTAVSLFEGNGSFVVKYELDGPIPQTDTFLVGLHGVSQDGAVVRQIGTKFLDGACIANFIFDHNAASQENFEYVPATDDAHLIFASYPMGPLEALGETPKFRGYLNFAGSDHQNDVPVEIVTA